MNSVMTKLAGSTLIVALALGPTAGLWAETQKGRAADGANAIIALLTEARTARAFSDQAVNKTDIETILRAGLAAPSARNSQPWFFAVVRNKALLKQIAADMDASLGEVST